MSRRYCISLFTLTALILLGYAWPDLPSLGSPPLHTFRFSVTYDVYTNQPYDHWLQAPDAEAQLTERYGITFPRGASLTYRPRRSAYDMRNTEENLHRLLENGQDLFLTTHMIHTAVDERLPLSFKLGDATWGLSEYVELPSSVLERLYTGVFPGPSASPFATSTKYTQIHLGKRSPQPSLYHSPQLLLRRDAVVYNYAAWPALLLLILVPFHLLWFLHRPVIRMLRLGRKRG